MEFPTYTELLNDIKANLTASGMTDVNNEGTASEQIISSFTSQSSKVSSYVRNVFANAFVSNASGVFLDIHGEEKGISRREALPAIVYASDKTLVIRANQGELINKVGSTIAQGTTVSTSDSLITYTLALITVPPGVQEVYVTAVAVTSGAAGNVSAGELNTLSFVADVTVTNEEAITNGVERETDTQYRSRLLATMQGNNSSSESSIVAAALSVPGVTTASILPQAFGVNHPALIISGPGKVKAALANVVESIVIPVLPFGSRITVLTPTFRSMDLTLVVKTRPEARNQTTKSEVESVVRANFFPHTPGTVFDMESLDQLITRNVDAVLDLEFTEVIIDGAEFNTNRISTEDHEQIILGSLLVELI